MGIITIFFVLLLAWLGCCLLHDLWICTLEQEITKKEFNKSMCNKTRGNYDNPSLGYIDSAMFLSMYDE